MDENWSDCVQKYIFFDLDGTLLNTREGITTGISMALKKGFGIEEKPENLCHFIVPPLKRQFMESYGFTEEQALYALKVYRQYYSTTGLYLNVPYDGIFKTAERLKNSGYILAVATSKPTVYSLQMLEKHGVLSLFQVVSGCNLDGTRETKIEVIRHAMEKLDICDPKQVVMVGDRKFDIWGGKEAGMTTVGVTYGFGSREELEKAGADFICSDATELSGYFIK